MKIGTSERMKEIVLCGQRAEEVIEPRGSSGCCGGREGGRESELLVFRQCRR